MIRITPEMVEEARERIERAGLTLIKGEWICENGVCPLLAVYLMSEANSPDEIREEFEYLRSLHYSLLEHLMYGSFDEDYVLGFILGWDECPPEELKEVEREALAVWNLRLGYLDGQQVSLSVPCRKENA